MNPRISPAVSAVRQVYRLLGGAASLWLLSGICPLHAQQDLETTVPANWAASTGALTISPNHYKMGSQSLCWDWSAGDVITISNPGINAADVTGYYKNTCDFWVWNGAALPGGKLRIEFMNGSTPQYWFDFYTDYTGWRHAVRSYSYDMGKKSSPSSTITSVRITAPASGSGSFYLDAIKWAGDRITRTRDAQNPDIAGSYSNIDTAGAYAVVPDVSADSPTSAELADLATLRSRWLAAAKGGSAPSASSVTSAGTSFAALNLVEDANGIRGQVIGDDTSAFLSWPPTLARDYAWGTATANASRDKMLRFIRHLMDQGQFVANSGDSDYGFYNFEELSNAMILMGPACDPEFKAKLYEAYRWSYQMGRHWTTDWERNTDEIYLGVTQRLGAILFLSPTDAEAVRQLKGFRRYLERFTAFSEGSEDGIKVDGIGFHHRSHYNNYLYAYSPLTSALYYLRGTSFQATQPTYENLRHAVLTEMRMSASAGGSGGGASVGYFGNALCGRKPFQTNVNYSRDYMRQLGEIGGAVYGQSADSVVARAYNRYFGVNDYALFTPYGVENAPDGFYQFNYSPLGIYRRANWVASMRAPQRYFWSSEIFSDHPDNNRYGRYQAYGALEILYNGGRAMSGGQLNGWDWNQPPGTTTIVLPDSKLVAANDREDVRSQINFSGALAFQDGQSGLYAGNFQEDNTSANYNPSFVWRKSWFAFGNEIICLGSDISNNDAVNPTATTLFQGALAAQGTAITLDGGTITSFPYSNTASGAGAHWLLDAQGTGFITQSGANVKISRATQTSANQTGSGSPTTGNFAKAWLDHGNAPNGAAYEYAVFPATNATAMASAASDHGNASTKPYEVIERDSTAHVVKWKADGKIGYAVYNAGVLPAATGNAGLLTAVQRPCLVMTKPGASGDATLSVVDPDLNFTNPEAGYGLVDASVARTLDLTLNGFWSLDNPPAGVSIVAASASTMTIRVTTQHGFAVHVHLVPAATAPAFAPVFSPSSFTFPTASMGSAYSGSIASYASDGNAGDTLTFSKVSGPTWLGVAATGTLSGTPGGGDGGENTFTVRVTDSTGLTADATLQILVTGNGTLSNDAGGSWQTASNWSSGQVAIGADKTANFGTLNLTANATLTLDGARTIGNLVFGDTTPSHNWTLATGTGGPLTLDVSTGSPTITVNNQTATLSVAIAGTKGLTKAGAGTLLLTGANTYTGQTTVGVNATTSGGTLSFGGAQTLGSLSINNGTVNFLGGSTVNFPASASINTASGTGNNLRILNVAGVVSNAGTLNMSGGSTFNLNAGANWAQSGGMSVKPNATYTNSVLNVNAGAVFKYTGTSTISLSASSGSNGGSATLAIAGGSFETGQGFVNSGGTAGAANLILSNGGALKLTADVATLASNSGTTTPFNIQFGTGGGIIDTNGFSTAVSQGVTGAGGLAKQGSGTLTLSGSNTYSGVTTVNAGTLVVTGSLGAGSVAIANGATLGGTGSVGGALTIQSGGTLAVSGGSIGTLTVNNTLNLAGTASMEVSKSGATLIADKVIGVTTLTYGGALTVTHLGPDALVVGDRFQLFAAATYNGSFSDLNLPALAPNLVWDTSNLSVDGSIGVRALPVAAADTMTSPEDAVATIAVLANDSDADGDELSIQSVTQGAHGIVTIVGSNVTYTPAANWSGADSFNYTITDNKEGATSATVAVTVTTVNDAPTFTSNPISKPAATQDGTYSNTLAGSATDVDAGDTLTYSKVSGPDWLSVATNGALSGTPGNADAGANSFTVKVTDAAGVNASATLNITVINVNDAPTFTANPISTQGATIGVAYSGSLAGSATDVDAGDTFTFSKISGPAWLGVAGDGTLSGTPPGGSAGTNSFTVCVTDATGANENATLDIMVSGGLPSGWNGQDIGSVSVPGGSSESDGTYTVSGSGADIWNSADGFQFVSKDLVGDGEIRARVTSQTNTDGWAKAGVMIRDGSGGGAVNALVAITPGHGFTFQSRATEDGVSIQTSGIAQNAAPDNWVRLTRSGALITAYVSADGTAWTQLGTVTISMNATVSAGLAVTSHNDSALSTATFDNVSVTPFPAPWQTVDIGATGLQGSAEYFGSAYTVKGAGTIGGSADKFRFAYQVLSGDGEIKARIVLPQNTGSGARVGVMIRDTLATDSPFAFAGVDGGSNYYWQRRRFIGSGHFTTAGGSGTAPGIWVRVVRTGSTFRGYKSADGVNWTTISSMGIDMGTNIYVGLAVSSGDTTTLNTTIFGNVEVVP